MKNKKYKRRYKRKVLGNNFNTNIVYVDNNIIMMTHHPHEDELYSYLRKYSKKLK